MSAFDEYDAKEIHDLLNGLYDCSDCNKPATRRMIGAWVRFCDKHHRGQETIELPRARLIRDLQAALKTKRAAKKVAKGGAT